MFCFVFGFFLMYLFIISYGPGRLHAYLHLHTFIQKYMNVYVTGKPVLHDTPRYTHTCIKNQFWTVAAIFRGSVIRIRITSDVHT